MCVVEIMAEENCIYINLAFGCLPKLLAFQVVSAIGVYLKKVHQEAREVKIF
jgi:hypothetical protein